MNYENSTDDLMSLQIKLEEEMTNRGAERYFRDVSKARQAGREDGTAYGQQILASRLDLVAEGIKNWTAAMSVGQAGNNATAYKKTKDMDPHTLAFLTLKNVLAGVSSPRTVQFVGVAIGTAVEDELRFSKIREEERKAYDKLVEGAKKRSAYHYKHAYAIRRADRVDDWVRWSRTERLHVGLKLLDILMNTLSLVELTHQKTDKEQSIKYVRPTQETIDWIEKKNDVTSILRPVYEPMVVHPKDWTNPFDGGYISSNIKPLKLVKTKNREYLEELRNVDMPIVYEAINALQRTPWQINSQVLKVMIELWESGSTLAGLPSRSGVELPPVPRDIAENDEAKKEYRIAAAKAHVHNLSLAGQRIAFNISLNIAKRYEKFRRIFFPYQMDFRGRIYAVPHLNPQGSDHQKALLRFANGKPLGTEGWKWLAVHGSNTAGNDKVSFEARVQWVLDNEEEILAIASNPYDNRGWCSEVGGVEIDSPWQFLAFCFEWQGYCEHGDEFVSKIPVGLDGSCSGLQHFSCALRDEVGGAAVNLVPSELPQDVYKQVADKVIEMVNEDLVAGTEDEIRHTEGGEAYVKEGGKTLAKQWLEFGITRKTTKRSVMTLAYGSKEYGFKEQLMEDLITPARLAANTDLNHRFPFSRDGYMAATYMAKKIWLAVNQTLVKASEAMKWLQQVASLAASEELPVRWITPIGFPVVQAYPDVEQRKIKTAISGKVVYLTMYREKDRLNRRRQSQGISPNFIHSADAAHLMLTVVRCSQEGVSNFSMIHDSFGTTAGDVETLFRVVRESFVEMYQTVDLLGDFAKEISEQLSEKNRDKLPELPAHGSLDISRVVDSRYCFA
jgi:DNA-directed RNA polymerase, mitochondrial